MTLNLNLNSVIARAAIILGALAAEAFLIFGLHSYLTVVTLVDGSNKISPDELAAATAYYPNSARIYGRLAGEWLEKPNLVRGMADGDPSAIRAVKEGGAAAARAVSLSPWEYDLRLLLARAQALSGDFAAAEQSLQAALRFAPHYSDVHWEMGTVLVMKGQIDQALGEFRVAVASAPARLPLALELVWGYSRGNPRAVESITGSQPEARLALAQCLLAHAQIADAAHVFNAIDRQARLASPDSAKVLDALIAAGNLELTRDLWLDLVGGYYPGNRPIIWNGSFESESPHGLSHFDWTLSHSRFAQIVIAPGMARTGRQSLRIEFAGLDTTRLDGEIKQLVLVRPGAHYRLECYAKTEELVTSESLRVAVATRTSSTPLAASAPVTTGTHDWQMLTLEFVAPEDASALLVTIKRIPKFSYDEPTRGTVWFDDFTMVER